MSAACAPETAPIVTAATKSPRIATTPIEHCLNLARSSPVNLNQSLSQGCQHKTKRRGKIPRRWQSLRDERRDQPLRTTGGGGAYTVGLSRFQRTPSVRSCEVMSLNPIV